MFLQEGGKMQRPLSKSKCGEWKEGLIVQENGKYYCTHCNMSGHWVEQVLETSSTTSSKALQGSCASTHKGRGSK
jgi:hypothetical protein